MPIKLTLKPLFRDHIIHLTKTRKSETGRLLSPENTIRIGNVSVTPYFSGDGSEEIENAVGAYSARPKK